MSEEKLDRFARGELSSMESRELARNALDDPELFDELTYTAIARTALPGLEHRRNVRLPLAVMAAAAAAVIVLLSLYTFRPSRPAPLPVVAMSGPPIFLAQSANSNTVFRGTTPESRAPRPTGSVTSIEDGFLSIDLGSLDGLAKGGEVEAVRQGKILGKIKLITIFRERGRAEAPPGLAVHLNDQIRVPPAQYVRAVLDQIAAFSARGDSDGARRIAEQAGASENLDVSPAGYADSNNLGGIAELSGDRGKAQLLYEQALRANPPQEVRNSIETNLARVRGAK
jgi:hypothetical protein